MGENIEIVKYSPSRKKEWDNFVEKSKNGVFLFYRDYMEYHSDRFKDFSLMIYNKGRLVSLLPANISGNTLFSHAGLTFGGFITDTTMTVSLFYRIFEKTINYLKDESISKLVYKCIPYIYHLIPAEEDRYVLFRFDARLIRRDVTSTIYLSNQIGFYESRYRCIKKAKRNGIIVKQSNEFEKYWEILTENLLNKYKKKPVHSIEEIKYLHNKFPNHIKLFAAYKDNIMLAGVVMYESNMNVAHAQYIANSPIGRKMNALDILFEYLINYYAGKKKYFDFGISTEQEGRYLNESLIFYKESFGARACVHDFYEVDVK
jgi:hypothetical protein